MKTLEQLFRRSIISDMKVVYTNIFRVNAHAEYKAKGISCYKCMRCSLEKSDSALDKRLILVYVLAVNIRILTVCIHFNITYILLVFNIKLTVYLYTDKNLRSYVFDLLT